MLELGSMDIKCYVTYSKYPEIVLKFYWTRWLYGEDDGTKKMAVQSSTLKQRVACYHGSGCGFMCLEGCTGSEMCLFMNEYGYAHLVN